MTELGPGAEWLVLECPVGKEDIELFCVPRHSRPRAVARDSWPQS